MPVECMIPERVTCTAKPSKMSRVCKQVSIESPVIGVKDFVLNSDVMVPDVPLQGARVKVMCAGACYRQRSCSVSSTSSSCSVGSDSGHMSNSPSHRGLRDASFYPGYEVAGVVESLGEEVEQNSGIKIGDHVIIYPFDDVPPGYAEYISVPEIKYLVKVPDSMPLGVAAMLPSGALWALNCIQKVDAVIHRIAESKGPNGMCHILIVGTGGLGLWALRLARYYFGDKQSRVHIAVACLKDEGFCLAQESGKVDVIQWNEELYEKILIERTKDACQGEVDIVIDFGTTSRSLNRSIQCLSKGGAVFLGYETAERLLPKFSRKAEEYGIHIEPVENGTIEQLHELVGLVSSEKVQPPPYTVFPAENASEVITKLCRSEIAGRAILQFNATA